MEFYEDTKPLTSRTPGCTKEILLWFEGLAAVITRLSKSPSIFLALAGGPERL